MSDVVVDATFDKQDDNIVNTVITYNKKKFNVKLNNVNELVKNMKDYILTNNFVIPLSGNNDSMMANADAINSDATDDDSVVIDTNMPLSIINNKQDEVIYFLKTSITNFQEKLHEDIETVCKYIKPPLPPRPRPKSNSQIGGAEVGDFVDYQKKIYIIQKFYEYIYDILSELKENCNTIKNMLETELDGDKFLTLIKSIKDMDGIVIRRFSQDEENLKVNKQGTINNITKNSARKIKLPVPGGFFTTNKYYDTINGIFYNFKKETIFIKEKIEDIDNVEYKNQKKEFPSGIFSKLKIPYWFTDENSMKALEELKNKFVSYYQKGLLGKIKFDENIEDLIVFYKLAILGKYKNESNESYPQKAKHLISSQQKNIVKYLNKLKLTDGTNKFNEYINTFNSVNENDNDDIKNIMVNLDNIISQKLTKKILFSFFSDNQTYDTKNAFLNKTNLRKIIENFDEANKKITGELNKITGIINEIKKETEIENIETKQAQVKSIILGLTTDLTQHDKNIIRENVIYPIYSGNNDNDNDITPAYVTLFSYLHDIPIVIFEAESSLFSANPNIKIIFQTNTNIEKAEKVKYFYKDSNKGVYEISIKNKLFTPEEIYNYIV